MQPANLTDYLSVPSEVELALALLFRREAPKVILDIGSCEGEDSIRYSRRFPSARVFAFEPLPDNQHLISANLTRFAATNVELVPLALSDQQGEATFHVSSGRPRELFCGEEWNYGNKSSSLLPPSGQDPMYGWIEFREKIIVSTDTLESFCRTRRIERVDFIHMDVQGAEHLVLAGAGSMLAQIGTLWMEVSDKELYQGQILRADMESFMRAHGFALGFEVRRDLEGDQFYVNTRLPRCVAYLAGQRTRSIHGRARMAAGRMKRALLG